MTQWFLSFLFLHCVLASQPTKCQICEDVAQTWHDKYPCVGNTLEWGQPDSPEINACQFPTFNCNSLTAGLKSACFLMTKQLVNIHGATIWTTLMDTGDAYKTCDLLGMCPKPTEIENNSEEEESEDPNKPNAKPWPCSKVFQSKLTKYDWKHKRFTESCTEPCYLCTWLVKDWPLFQQEGICQPKGTKMPMNPMDPYQKWPSNLETIFPFPAGQKSHASSRGLPVPKSFGLLETGAALRQGRGYRLRQTPAMKTRLRRKLGPTDLRMAQTDLGLYQQTSEQMSRELAMEVLEDMSSLEGKNQMKGMVTATTGFTTTENCFNMWEEFRASAKARYFLSWKTWVNSMRDPIDALTGNLWDANIACKCLGKCEIQPFENLALVGSCAFDNLAKKQMDILAANSGDIAVTQQ